MYIENDNHGVLLNIIEHEKWDTLKNIINQMHVADIVEVLEKLDEENCIKVFDLLDKEKSIEVFSEMDIDIQESILSSAKNSKIKYLLKNMYSDDIISMFEDIEEKVSQKIMPLMSNENINMTKEILEFPEDSIGRLITLEYLSVTPDYSVAKTIDYIRKNGRDSEIFEIVYIVDDIYKLIGYVSLKDLMFAKKDSNIEDIIHTDIISISVYSDQEEAVVKSKKYNLISIPVINENRTLLGIITIDDILDIAEEEDTEDFHKIMGISDMGKSISSASVFMLYRKRILWLFILVFVNTISGAIIANYYDLMSKYISLIFFLPLLIGSAGNAGAQSSTLIIRSLTTGDIKKTDWFIMLIKELLVSAALALTMSIFVSFIAFFRGGLMLSLVVSGAMFLVVIIGSIIGAALPFILGKLKLDPATSSVPLVSSLCDISGSAIYLMLATFILSRQ